MILWPYAIYEDDLVAVGFRILAMYKDHLVMTMLVMYNDACDSTAILL
jgi:hypothetical protein